jgi:uncharacterized membrane protein HdeD (DUF308 family)
MDRYSTLLKYVVGIAAAIVGVSVLVDGGPVVFAILVLLLAAWFVFDGVRAGPRRG